MDTKAVACISILILPIKTHVLSKVDKKYIPPSFHIAEHSPSNTLVKQNAQYTILAICDQSIKCMHSPLTLTISVCIIFRLQHWLCCNDTAVVLAFVSVSTFHPSFEVFVCPASRHMCTDYDYENRLVFTASLPPLIGTSLTRPERYRRSFVRH